MATLKDGLLYSVAEGHQRLIYALIQILLLSLQCCHDFQTRKLACIAIWLYVDYIEHVFF